MDEAKTLPQALKAIVHKQPNRVAMRKKDYGIWHDITWVEYYEQVKKVAMGLYALGVKRGDHVAIVGGSAILVDKRQRAGTHIGFTVSARDAAGHTAPRGCVVAVVKPPDHDHAAP